MTVICDDGRRFFFFEEKKIRNIYNDKNNIF